MRRAILTVVVLLLTAPSFAQVIIQFMPEINGRNLNGLFNCNLINGNRSLNATLAITVSERQGGTVLNIKTPEFILQPGNNPVPAAAVRAAAVGFGNNKLAQILKQSRAFPNGDYEYCYELSFRNTDNPPLQQCFSYTLEPFTELNLIDPYNQDSLCNKRPVFSWQPLLPGIPGSNYQLVLSEIKAGQSATEALNYNLPIINQSNIVSPVLPYPAIAKDLDIGKKYAWQVTAYKEQTILNRSEVWTFIINCQDSIKKVVDDRGYRTIEDLIKGNYYIAEGEIRFAIINPYHPQNLRYEILPLSNPDKKVRHLPKIKLLTGNNKIVIDFSENNTLVDGSYYLLNIWLPDQTKKSLRLIYKERR